VDWLPDASERSMREALGAAAPDLAGAAIDSVSKITTSNPEWCTRTAVVADSFLVKFAWSEPSAARVLREARVLAALADAAPDLPIPRLIGASSEPVAFVTRFVDGVPLGLGENRAWAIVAAELATFLACLHDDAVLTRVSAHVPGLVEPHPQATTAAIRTGLPPFLDERRARLALEWCDWVDEILAVPPERRVLVHGDLHGYNQVWDPSEWRLRLVADFEVAGPAEPEYDLRYLPPVEPTLGLVRTVADRYGALTGHEVDLRRAMAWHIRTALGDALWRSEAGVPLPGDCTPATYADDIERKLVELAGRDL
jgi:aminoglycoside phosphotransferase (APT) family kinase protein